MPQLTHTHTTPTPRANRIEREADEAQLRIMAAFEAAGIEVIVNERMTLAELMYGSDEAAEHAFAKMVRAYE